MSAPEPRPTFLFADLSGFTALTEAHGDERAADLAEAFFAATRRLLARYGASEVKTMGYAVMLHVPDAVLALCLAVCLVDSWRSDQPSAASTSATSKAARSKSAAFANPSHSSISPCSS